MTSPPHQRSIEPAASSDKVGFVGISKLAQRRLVQTGSHTDLDVEREVDVLQLHLGDFSVGQTWSKIVWKESEELIKEKSSAKQVDQAFGPINMAK